MGTIATRGTFLFGSFAVHAATSTVVGANVNHSEESCGARQSARPLASFEDNPSKAATCFTPPT